MRRFLLVGLTLSAVLAASPALSLDDLAAPTPSPTPEPEREGFFKRTIRTVMDDDKGDDYRGIHWGPFEPRAEIVSASAGPAPVLHFWAPDIAGTSLDFHAAAAYSVYGYQYYEAQFGRVPYVGRRLPRTGKGTSDLFPLADIESTGSVPGFHIFVSARHRDYPREDFYGVGPDSQLSNRTDYRLRDDLFEGVIQTRLSRMSVMVRAGLMRPSIHPGTNPEFPDIGVSNTEATAPGLTSTPDFTHLSAGLWLEMRDHPSNPHRGLALGLAVSRFDERNATAYDFTRVVMDAREYVSLGSPRHVIALREVAFLDSPDAGSLVPFYLQPNFSGSTFLRAFNWIRYRDNKLLTVAAEYRLAVHRNVQLALIYEAGEVSPTMNDFSMKTLKHDYGAGLRLTTLKRTLFLVDVLKSPERMRVDVRLGSSF